MKWATVKWNGDKNRAREMISSLKPQKENRLKEIDVTSWIFFFFFRFVWAEENIQRVWWNSIQLNDLFFVTLHAIPRRCWMNAPSVWFFNYYFLKRIFSFSRVYVCMCAGNGRCGDGRGQSNISHIFSTRERETKQNIRCYWESFVCRPFPCTSSFPPRFAFFFSRFHLIPLLVYL